MDTNEPTTESAIDLDAFLEAYLSRAHTLGSLAKAMNTSVSALFEFMQLPHVARYIAMCEDITERREKILAASAITQTMHELSKLCPLPESPTAADYDNRRRVLDGVRRGADLLRKLYTPAPRAAATRLQITPELTENSPIGPASNQLATVLTQLAKLTPKNLRAAQGQAAALSPAPAAPRATAQL
jgi:hypothetical protein